MADSSDNKGSWVEQNIVHPAGNSLKEMANAGINLVNIALPKNAELTKFDANYNEKQTTVGMLVSGAVSVIPYALAGGVLGRALRFVPAGESAWLLHSEQFAQIAGAAGYDGMRDLRPGETTFGNIAGSVAGFGTFEAGNYAIKGLTFGGNRAVQLAARLPLRFGVGAAGGAMGSVFSDLGSGRTPELTKLPEAAITSGGLNALLPTAQSLIFKGLGLRSSPMRMAHADSNDAPPPAQPESTKSVPVAHEQEPTVAVSPSTIKLNETPGWSVFQNYGTRLHFEEMERSKLEPDEPMPQFKMQQLEDLTNAQRNMEKIARGDLSDSTRDYIARGWLPADALKTAQEKLGADLGKVTASSIGKVADLADYKHEFLVDRKDQLQELTGNYQGSTTRLLLKALGTDSDTLGDWYRRMSTSDNASMKVDPQKIDSMSAAKSEPGPTRNTELQVAKFARAIAWAERSLANPETRETTVKGLDAARMNQNPLVDRYATAELGRNRVEGPVDLSKYPSWQEAYRTLAALERYEFEHDGRFAHDPFNAGFWTRRALTHMEQIATGDFPPAVKAEFDKHPEVLNQMRAQLEYDLDMRYRQGSGAFAKEPLANVYGDYSPLFQNYIRSPMYRFIHATTGDVPPQLERMYNHLRVANPAWRFINVEDGTKALYAIERGLMDDTMSGAIRKDLNERMRYGNDYEPIQYYAKLFERKYSKEPQPEGPTPPSNVVQFNPRGDLRSSPTADAPEVPSEAAEDRTRADAPDVDPDRSARLDRLNTLSRGYYRNPITIELPDGNLHIDKTGARDFDSWLPKYIAFESEHRGESFAIERRGTTNDGQGIWSILTPTGGEVTRHGTVRAMENGRHLNIFGTAVEIDKAYGDWIAEAAMIKSNIEPVVRPQVEEFAGIAAPIEDLDKKLQRLNDIRDPHELVRQYNDLHMEIDSFLDTHHSLGFKDAIMEWAERQPSTTVRDWVFDHYDRHQMAWTRYFREMASEERRAGDSEQADWGFSDIIKARSNLHNMVKKSWRGVSEKQYAETERNLLELLDDGRDPQSTGKSLDTVATENYKRAALQAFIHAENPETISQWSHPSCALSGLEYRLYTKHPEIATRLLRDTLQYGGIFTTDGRFVKMDPFSMVPEPTALRYDRNNFHAYRTYASQILQILEGNIYWQKQTENPAGQHVPPGSMRYEMHTDADGKMREYIVDHYDDVRWPASGFSEAQIKEIENQIAPGIEGTHVPRHALRNPASLKTWLERVPIERFPVRVSVDSRHLNNEWHDPEVQRHAMDVDAIYDPAEHRTGKPFRYMVMYKNPWDTESKHMTVRQLWEMSYQRPNYEDNPKIER